MATNYQRKESIVCRHIGDEVILVPVKNNLADMLNLFVLNPVGECIWDALSKPCSIDQMCIRIQQQFDVDETAARADCESFIGELRRADLLLSA